MLTSRMSSKRRCWPRRVPFPLPSSLQIFDEQSRPSPKEMRAVLEQLAADYEGRGVAIKETATGFRFQVRTRVRARSVAPVARPPAQVLARVARNPRAHRLSPADHARRDRERARRRGESRNRQDAHGAQLGARRRSPRRARTAGVVRNHRGVPRLLLAEVHRRSAAARRHQIADRPQPAAAVAGGWPGNGRQWRGHAVDPDAGTDAGEVAVVPVLEASIEDGGDRGLDASSDDDADDEELSAPGDSAAGLVAAPPSDET